MKDMNINENKIFKKIKFWGAVIGAVEKSMPRSANGPHVGQQRYELFVFVRIIGVVVVEVGIRLTSSRDSRACVRLDLSKTSSREHNFLIFK